MSYQTQTNNLHSFLKRFTQCAPEQGFEVKPLQVKLFSMCSDTLFLWQALYGNLLAVIAPHRQSASFRGRQGH